LLRKLPITNLFVYPRGIRYTQTPLFTLQLESLSVLFVYPRGISYTQTPLFTLQLESIVSLICLST